LVPLVLVIFVMVGRSAWNVEAVQEGPESALAVVKATLSDVLALLDDPKLPESEKRRRIEEVVATRFDYREMYKRTLAAHWGRLTEPEWEDFVASFRMFLSDRYAGKIRDYAEE
jgi:phospholipid transport system substrate-binding protein